MIVIVDFKLVYWVIWVFGDCGVLGWDVVVLVVYGGECVGDLCEYGFVYWC